VNDLTLLALLKRLQDQIASVTKQVGPKGERGPAGKDGTSIKGEKGDRGEMGVGRDGHDGPEGSPGMDGKDGVSVTGVELGADDSLIFQFSNGDEDSVELPSLGKGGDTYISHGGSGSTLPEQVTPAELAAGTETELRSFSPADIAAAPISSHSHSFASLTSIPTTISGYTIADAYTKTEIDTMNIDGGYF